MSLNNGQKCRKPVFMQVSGICFTKWLYFCSICVQSNDWIKKYIVGSEMIWSGICILKDMMNTTAGKKMAEHRQEVMEVFLEEFMAEWNGEK